MAQCKNDVLFNKVFREKLTDNTEITFDIIRDLPDCRKINTKNYISVASGATYDRFAIPENLLECLQESCVNTGTLTLPTAGDAVYFLAEDASEYAAGVIAGYAKQATAGTLTVTLSADSTFAAADVYEVSLAAIADAYQPFIVDLGATPTSVVGGGWSPSPEGTYIKFTTAVANAGLSSILILDDMEAFETTTVVKISCPTEVSGDISLTTENVSCTIGKYDTTTLPTITKTVTGKKTTSNFDKLNPMYGKGEKTKGFVIENVKKTATLQGNHAVVQVPNAYAEECGFYAAQVAEGCNADMLTRLTIPVLVDFDEDHFQVITSGTSAYFYFNAALAGKDIIISYPKESEIVETVDNFDNVSSFRARMSYPEILNDGTKIVRVYNNVLVTTVPDGLTNMADQTITFTLDIKPDKDNVYVHRNKIVA